MGQDGTYALSGPLSAYLLTLTYGRGLETPEYRNEGVPPISDPRVAQVFPADDHGRIDVELVRDRLRDALVDAAGDEDFRLTLQRAQGATTARTKDEVILIGQVLWNLATKPGDDRFTPRLLAPAEGPRLPVIKTTTTVDLASMSRAKRLRYAGPAGRGCLPEVGGGDSLKENGRKLANRMAQHLEARYGLPDVSPAATGASVSDALPLLRRGGDAATRILTWRDGFRAAPLAAPDDAGDSAAVALSARGDVAGAIDGDALHLWRDAAREEVDRSFVRHAMGIRGVPQLRAIAALPGGMLQLVTAHDSSTELWIRDRQGRWSSPRAIERSRALRSVALLGEAGLGITAEGRLTSWGDVGERPDVEEGFSRLGGFDAAEIGEHDVVAVWGAHRSGAPAGTVYARRLGGRRGWVALPLDGGAPDRLGIRRELDADAPARSASVVSFSGDRVTETAIELAEVL